MEGSRVSPVCLTILHTQGALTSDLIALEFVFLVFLASVVRNSEAIFVLRAMLCLCRLCWHCWRPLHQYVLRRDARTVPRRR